MLKTAVGAVLVLGLSFTILALMLPELVSGAEAARTEDATDSGLNCSTGPAETSCDISVTSEHAYADTTEMTVTETSPGSGDRTASTTVGTNRITLTVASLATSTAYTFDVAHRVVDPNVSDVLNGVLSRFGILLVIGLLGLGVFYFAKLVRAI